MSNDISRDEAIARAITEFINKDEQWVSEILATRGSRLQEAVNKAGAAWDCAEVQRLEEKSQGYIMSEDDFVKLIKAGETSFLYSTTERYDEGSRNVSNIKFNRDFLETVINPMLKNNTNFQIDNKTYGLEKRVVTGKFSVNTGETEYYRNEADILGDWPVYETRELPVAEEIIVKEAGETVKFR